MKTFFRAISLASFIMSGGLIGAGAYVYVQRDAIIENVKAEATEAIMEALPSLLGGALPGVDGGVLTPDVDGGLISPESGVPTPSSSVDGGTLSPGLGIPGL